MVIISTMVRWWRGSRVAVGVRVHSFDEIQELRTEEADAIDLARMDDDGWQLPAAPSGTRQMPSAHRAVIESPASLALPCWRRR